MSDDIAPPPSLEIPQGYQAIDIPSGFVRGVGPIYRRHDDSGLSMGFRVETRHTNGLRNAHGGMLMSFADMSWGHIVSIECSAYWVTVRLVVDFLASAKEGDWVEGASEVMSREDGLYVVRGRVWCADRTLMTGAGVFKPLQPRAPRAGEKGFVSE
jgi:acyl-coenzyme A thioesterase PaaI-like protein